jgi:hypothetical protein
MLISCILLKQTSYDIIRLMHLVTIVLNNDATAAYDCMIATILVHDHLCLSWHPRRCNSAETHSGPTNEILCQDCFWIFHRLL